MARKFTAEEKAAAKAALKDAEGEKAVLEAIKKMAPADKAIAERIHAIVRKAAPDSFRARGTGCPRTRRTTRSSASSRTPASSRSATRRSASRTRRLDDGSMWPTSYALTKLTKADEKTIGDLVKQAVGE